MTRNTEQVLMQQIHRLQADPHVQQLCAQWLNQVAHDPNVRQLTSGARTPLDAYVRVMAVVNPAALEGDITHIVGLQDQEYGPVPAARVGAPAASGDIDWGHELPAAAVLKAWKEIDPRHSRLPHTLPQTEALARHTLAKIGLGQLPGLSAGQTYLAYLHYAGKHSKALASGDRVAYDSLARWLGGELGDGEALRSEVEVVKQTHHDDHVQRLMAQRTAAAEAEAAKHRPKPVENPTYDPKKVPQNALKAKEKPPDGTHAEVERQYHRYKGQWELPEKRRMEPLRMTIRNKLQLDAAMALCKAKGEPYSRVFASVDPAFRKELVGHLRDNGLEPASAASTRATSGSERHWIPARSNTGSGESYAGESYPSGGYSGGTSPGGGSGEAASEAPAAAGGGGQP